MSISTNVSTINFNNTIQQKNSVNFRAATIPNMPNDTVEIQGKQKGLSKNAKIGIGLGVVGTIALAVSLLAKGKSSQAKEVLQHVDFKEAKTLEEAIKYGKEKLGIKEYANIDNLETINWINKGLSDVFNHSKGKATMPVCVLTDKSLMSSKDSIAEASTYMKEIGGHYINVNPEFIKNIDMNINKKIEILIKDKNLIKKDNIYKLPDILQSGEEATKIEQLLNKYKQNPNSFSWNDKISLYDSLRNVRAVCVGINISPLKSLKQIFEGKNLKTITYTIKNGSPKKLTIENIELLETKEQANILKALINNPSTKVIFKIRAANPHHTIYHELGHIQHEKTAKEMFKKMGKPEELKAWGITDDSIIKDFLNDTKKQQIAGKISDYATESPLEFVAETYAEIIRGSKISDETMELYKYYKGATF